MDFVEYIWRKKLHLCHRKGLEQSSFIIKYLVHDFLFRASDLNLAENKLETDEEKNIITYTF